MSVPKTLMLRTSVLSRVSMQSKNRLIILRLYRYGLGSMLTLAVANAYAYPTPESYPTLKVQTPPIQSSAKKHVNKFNPFSESLTNTSISLVNTLDSMAVDSMIVIDEVDDFDEGLINEVDALESQIPEVEADDSAINGDFKVKQLNQIIGSSDNILSTELESNTIETPLNAISPDTLKTFVKVIDITRRQYVNPINDEQLFENAMQGMLKKIDPYAEFLDAQSYKKLQAFTQGEIAQVGISAVYDKKLKNWVIDGVKAESPASEVGIKVGFYLHEIDGVKINQQTSLRQIRQLLQGTAGSMIDMIASDQGRRRFKYTLQRTLSLQQSVEVEIDRGVAVITVPVFQDKTKSQILDALVALKKPIFGMVIDLRDNPGGLLDSAVEISSLFQSNVGVVRIENKRGEQQILSTRGNSHLSKVPIIVLQNRFSASAAEVLASSLQYTGRAKVVGETSYGKGTVQSIIPINDNQAVKLTVAKYLQADGKKIDGVGIVPNIELSETENIETLLTLTPKQINTLNTRIHDIVYARNRDKKDSQLSATSGKHSSHTPEVDYQQNWQKIAVDILLAEVAEEHIKKQALENPQGKQQRLNQGVSGTKPKNHSKNMPAGIMITYPMSEPTPVYTDIME